MGNCNCDHCGCDEEKEEEKCGCEGNCDDTCACEHESTEEKATALKESMAKAIGELGYAVEKTDDGIRISE